MFNPPGKNLTCTFIPFIILISSIPWKKNAMASPFVDHFPIKNSLFSRQTHRRSRHTSCVLMCTCCWLPGKWAAGALEMKLGEVAAAFPQCLRFVEQFWRFERICWDPKVTHSLCVLLFFCATQSTWKHPLQPFKLGRWWWTSRWNAQLQSTRRIEVLWN